jgi:RecB family exonuclease
MTAWSYSSIKTFDQCPRKYYHTRVAKDFLDTPGPEAQYGTDVHTAAEEFVKNGTAIPQKYGYMKPVVEKLNAIPGIKYTELKLGIRKVNNAYEPCDFFDKDVWWRGVADFVVVDNSKGRSVDYKTGKNTKYADMKQLDLVAGGLFVHFPDLVEIKSGLAYVVANEFLPKKHVREDKDKYLSAFDNQLDRLESALHSGVWNTKPSGLCGWCPVKSCEHWRERRR